MLKTQGKDKNHTITHDGLNYLVVKEWFKDLPQLAEIYDGILIDTINVSSFLKIITQIKLHPQASVFLKPIFHKKDIPSNLAIHTDGLFDLKSLTTITNNILKRTTDLHTFKTESYDHIVKKKLLLYMQTRKGNLSPIKDRNHFIGYNYPLLDIYYHKNIKAQLQCLEEIVKEGLATTEIINQIQLCSTCKNSFLLFKETCPSCSSFELDTEDVVHHYNCAHVDILSNFMDEKSKALICPKCDKTLRHIGLDYDKPSIINRCRVCKVEFQETHIVADCHNCEKTNELDELDSHSVYTYHITMKGKIWAERNQEVSRNTISDLSIFEELVLQEKLRSKHKGENSYLLRIGFPCQFLDQKSNQFRQKLWEEILTQTKNYTMHQWHQSAKDNQLLLLLIDQPTSEYEKVVQKVKQNLQILLEDNINEKVELHLELEALK